MADFKLRLVGTGYGAFGLPLDPGKMQANPDVTASSESGVLGVGIALAGVDSTVSGESGTLFSNYFNTNPDVTVSSEVGALGIAIALGGTDFTISFESFAALSGTAVGKLSTDHKELLKKEIGPHIFIVDMGLPGGTRRESKSGFYCSDGLYLDSIVKWGTVTIQKSDRAGNMAASEFSFEMEDRNRSFARLTEGQYREDVEGSSVLFRLGHKRLPPASFRTCFTGVITKWTWPEEMKVRIVARTDDLAFRRKTPRSTWLLTGADWINIDPSAVSQYANIIYGNQNSQPYQATGMVKCHYVDTTTWMFCVGAGPINVGNVYLNGVAAVGVPSLEYRGGKQFTCITLDADPGPNPVVTADCTGYDCTTWGGGTMTTNPMDQLDHFITNFVIGDWKYGPWLTSTTRISPIYKAALRTFFNNQNIRGGMVIKDARNGYDYLSIFLKSFECSGWWDEYGQLCFKIEDPTDVVPYQTDPISFVPAGFNFEYDDQAIITALVGSYNYLVAEGKYMSSVNPTNPRRETDAPDTMDLQWWSVE